MAVGPVLQRLVSHKLRHPVLLAGVPEGLGRYPVGQGLLRHPPPNSAVGVVGPGVHEGVAQLVVVDGVSGQVHRCSHSPGPGLDPLGTEDDGGVLGSQKGVARFQVDAHDLKAAVVELHLLQAPSGRLRLWVPGGHIAQEVQGLPQGLVFAQISPVDFPQSPLLHALPAFRGAYPVHGCGSYQEDGDGLGRFQEL